MIISLHDVDELLLGILNIYLCSGYLHDVVMLFLTKKMGMRLIDVAKSLFS